MQAASFGSKFSLGSDTKRVTEERLVLEAAALEEEVALLQAGACAQPSTRLLSTTCKGHCHCISLACIARACDLLREWVGL